MFQKLRRQINRNLFGYDPDYHDLYSDPAEQFYGKIYLKYLMESIEAEFRGQKVRIIDVGCHTGRLSIPLAQAGHEVTGIDASRFLVKRAEDHAREAGVPCRFIRADGFDYVRKLPAGSVDLVLCTEVLYQCPDFQELLHQLIGPIRPGGLLATSHRTRFFYLTRAVREGDFETARFILSHAEGELWGSYYNWQTPAELAKVYETLELDLLQLRPVGVLTGNGGDGMAALCNLGPMSESSRQALFEIESFDSSEFQALGRYLLAIGRKRGL